METRRDLVARRGLLLPKQTWRRLASVGIYTRPEISLEYQQLARRYVIRGVESGGAIASIGRYITFAGENGEQIAYLHTMNSVGVNGAHAVVVAPALVRIDLFRFGRTYQLLITHHRPCSVGAGRRPQLEHKVVFRGLEGHLEAELWEKDRQLAGAVVPDFYSRSGEKLEIPAVFVPGVKVATRAVCCVPCSHNHYLVAGGAAATTTEVALPVVLPRGKDSFAGQGTVAADRA
jgi:hypothetical protein